MKKIVSALVALMMVACLSITAFAAVSPVATINKDYKGGTATFEKDSESVITLTAKAKKGYKFLNWDIDGNYEVVSGSLDSKTVVIKLKGDVDLSDVDATPNFKKIAVTSDDGNSDKDDVAPKTSDNGLGVLALSVLALGGLVVSKKKLAK